MGRAQAIVTRVAERGAPSVRFAIGFAGSLGKEMRNEGIRIRGAYAAIWRNSWMIGNMVLLTGSDVLVNIWGPENWLAKFGTGRLHANLAIQPDVELHSRRR
jgi:hypothetical protein